MKLEVKIEIRSIVMQITNQLANGNTHNFTVFVQGLNGNKIEHFVKKVVFYLPFGSSYSKQVKRKPPYLISGSAHASFRLPIDIFLHTDARKEVRYSYYVHLPDRPVENAVNVKTLKFLNAPQDFRERLFLGGAEVVNQTNSAAVATLVKTEPVDVIENQNESLGNEASAESEVVAYNEAADSKNTSETNVEHLVCKTKPVESNDIQNEIPNELSNSCVQSNDNPEQNSSLLIEGIYSFDELMKENEVLKKENEALFSKFNKQEGVIATYVEKLPVLQNNFSTVTTEFNQLKQRAEANEVEITSLKSTIQTFMSEILEYNNKVEEVKGQMKRRKKASVSSSSFVSESFPNMTSISLENEPYTNSSHKVLSNEKGMSMNKCTISRTSLEFQTSSADSNIMQDSYKNQLNSSYYTSENMTASSSFSHLNANVSACVTTQTVQKAPTPETFLDSSHNKAAYENSHNFSMQNKSSSPSINLNGTWSIYKSLLHRKSSVYPSGNATSLRNPSLSSQNFSSVPSVPTESTSSLRELPSSEKNISTFDELQSMEQNSFQKESGKNLTEGLIQHYVKDKHFSGNSFDRKIDEISSLNHKERNPEYPYILEISQGQNSSKKEQSKNIFVQVTQQCTKNHPQVFSSERRNTEPSTSREPQDSSLEAKKAEYAILKPEKANIRILSTQCDSLCRQADKELPSKEPLSAIKELVNLNLEAMDVVLPDSATSLDYFQKEVCKNVLEEPYQLYVEGDLQIIEDEEHNNSKHKEKDYVPNVLKTVLCQNVTKEKANNCREDKVQVFSSNQKESFSKRYPVKEIQTSTKEDCLEEKLRKNGLEEVTPKQIKSKLHESLSKRKNMKFTNLIHKERNTMSSNCESISIENNSLQKESTKHLSKKSIQEYVKGGLQVNLNQQKRDPVVSNFIHLKDSSLNMKRTIFLPIPEDPKRPCRTKQNLYSVKQKIMCSVPRAALFNNSDSVKRSKIGEQVCLPVKNSLDTITIGGKTSSPIPVEIKSTVPENDSVLNSLDRNPCFTTETNRNESDSACINPSAQFQKRAKNTDFKKRKSEAKSSNSIESLFKDIDDRLICEAKRNYYVHLLTEFLTNPKNCPNISVLIFLVIEHLQRTEKNYLCAFVENRANCIFLPSSESCIVSTLFEIEKKSEPQSKLTENILNTIYHLLMAENNCDVSGLASLCRVFTEICKRKSDLMKPLALCVDMLKVKLRFAPYLIASMAGVWREPFLSPSDQSEEAMILLGSISLGAGKEPGIRDHDFWLYSVDLISEYCFPSLPDVNVAINFLKDKIISNCTQNSHEKSWMVTSSFVVLAGYQPWEWTKQNLIYGFIVPNLERFSNQEPNEKAFALFCDLCVIGYNPCNRISYKVLRKYYHQAQNKGNNFVQEWAAVYLVKYMILNSHPIYSGLLDFIENNPEKVSVENLKELYQRKHFYYCKRPITIEDIVIT